MTLGLLASAFDPFHPGYPWAMDQALEAGVCTGIIAALHTDPSLLRGKPRPTLTVEERGYLLASLRQVVDVIPYDTEEDLYELICTVRPAVRILGDDYIGQAYVGDDLPIPVFYAKRQPGWSGTEFRKRLSSC
jgi:glycerol-3-phosphate cytidylyltransferase